MDYINFKTENLTFFQRNEFSKLILKRCDNSELTIEDYETLSQSTQQIIKDYLKIKESPNQYFEYRKINNDGDIAITNYIGENVKNVIIPESIDGKKVIAIDDAFTGISNAERISIPDTVKRISPFCFAEMPNLKFIRLSPKINIIPEGSFKYCTSLKYINLNNIQRIDNYAFTGCNKLEKINLNITQIIGKNVFENCLNLENIELPAIEYLEENAFRNCKKLESALLGNSLEKINYATFEYCENLKEVKIPSKLQQIDKNAFKDCKKLKSICFPEGLIAIGKSAFSGSGLEGELTFPKSLKSIRSYAFARTNIDKINICRNTEYIGEAFPINALVNINIYDLKADEKIKPNIEKEITIN